MGRNERAFGSSTLEKVLLGRLYSTYDTKDNNAKEIKEESQNVNASFVLILESEHPIHKRQVATVGNERVKKRRMWIRQCQHCTQEVM